MPAIYPKGFLGQEHRRIHKASCFVLRPFHEDFDEVFRTLVLALQSQELNLLCRRADDFRRPNILETILSSIAQAEFIIADLTGLNPNVFYELGIAHCVKEPENVVLLTQSLDFVPFDLRHLRCIVYELAPAGLQALRTELLATFHEAAKDAFRFRVWEGKRFVLGRKLVGRNNNLFELTIECAHLGHGAVKIEPTRVQAVVSAQGAEDLFAPLQGAIELEHSTLPVYLTALFSIKPGAMPDVRQTLASVAVEEMLHLSIACNVLNAIGGRPVLDSSQFVPRYPGPLPMSINTSLRVHLAPLSLARIEDEFMEIEEPETPLVFKVVDLEAAIEFATIGQFYRSLIERISELGDGIFTGDPARQVVGQFFSADQLFAVHDVASAARALSLVVEQGEGTSTSPLDPDGGFAHYYRFQEIVKGRRLRPDSSPEGFSFSGPPIVFDPAGVWDMVSDPQAAAYRPGSRARTLCDAFNRAYTSLLGALHNTFNGEPATLTHAMGLMFERTRLISAKVCAWASWRRRTKRGAPGAIRGRVVSNLVLRRAITMLPARTMAASPSLSTSPSLRTRRSAPRVPVLSNGCRKARPRPTIPTHRRRPATRPFQPGACRIGAMPCASAMPAGSPVGIFTSGPTACS